MKCHQVQQPCWANTEEAVVVDGTEWEAIAPLDLWLLPAKDPIAEGDGDQGVGAKCPPIEPVVLVVVLQVANV